MWISPNHPNPPRPFAPPEDDGQQLAALPRGDGRTELRVVLKTYQGHPYVAIRLWERDDRGGWWPTRRGIAIRMGECERVAEALRNAVAAAKRTRPVVQGAGQGDDGPRPGRSVGPPGGRVREAPGGTEFNEFA